MKKALIVDDIPEYVDTMEVYLEDRFDVLTAQSLEEAKSVLKDNPIDLAIIDIRLNEEDPGNKEGIDLLKWLRERMPEAGVIVMSAYKEFDYAVEALNAGADYFMRKPIDPDELNSVIDKIFSNTPPPQEIL